MKVLGPAEVAAFVEQGFCRLPGAFDAEAAREACGVVWRRMAEKRGIEEDDPATWPAAYDIEEHLDHDAVRATFTDRLAAGIEDLVGPGRWTGFRNWGLWPVNFYYGRAETSPIPTTGWHIDGNWFTHTLDCPRQGLLVIGLFTDVAVDGGGTLVATGSHRRTARVLAAHPEGLSHRALFDLVLAEPLEGFVELTGAAGDVVLAHPFLFHTRGYKRKGPPRVISNTEAPLRAPLSFARPDGDYSPLEESIRAAVAEMPREPGPAALRCRF